MKQNMHLLKIHQMNDQKKSNYYQQKIIVFY